MKGLWADPAFREKQAAGIKTRRKRGEAKAERDERRRRRELKKADRESRRARRRSKRELRNRPLSKCLAQSDRERIRPWQELRTCRVTIMDSSGRIYKVPMYLEDELLA